MPIKDKVGQKFGKLTVVRLSHTGNRGVAFWECSCECGGRKVVLSSALGRDVFSCGCIRKGMNGFNLKTHGATGTTTHRIWKSIVSRCTIPSATGFQNYGGRGITICDRWLDFTNFLEDMGERPSEKHSVDRIDYNAGYSPENCRWATSTEQNRNTRANRKVTVDGVTRCVSEWAEIVGVHESLIRQRMDRGWTPEAAVKTPKNSSDRGLLSGTSRTITVDGVTRTVFGWAKHLGVAPHTIKNRLKRCPDGEAVVRALMHSG